VGRASVTSGRQQRAFCILLWIRYPQRLFDYYSFFKLFGFAYPPAARRHIQFGNCQSGFGFLFEIPCVTLVFFWWMGSVRRYGLDVRFEYDKV
jgi:hypothetical protein